MNPNMEFPSALSNEKSLECSETKEYAKIFCDIFARVSVTNLKLILKFFYVFFPFRPKKNFYFKIIHSKLLLFQIHIYLYM